LKKPTSLMQLYSFIFIILGPIFIFAGYLNKSGMLQTSKYSKGDPALIFPILGIISLIIGLNLFYIPFYKEKNREELKFTGMKIEGVVTKIIRNNRFKFGKQSPYIIYFSYEYDEDKYNEKSCLLWDKPTINVGDIISVYIDEYKTHKYFTNYDIFPE